MKKRYCIKSHANKVEFIDILKEIEDGYIVRFTRLNDGREKISEETITNNLLNMCLKTGYIFEMENVSVA